MPSDLSAEQRTRTVRAFLKLCIASSILQSALHLTIYWLHLSPRSSYLLALVPIAPLGAAVVGAVRKRTAETDPYVRRAYLGAMIIPGFITAMTLVLIKQSFSYRDSLGFAINNSAMALVFGGLFVFMLLMPKSMLDGRNLGDLLSPLRNKLLTPTQNRILRTAALFFVYIALSLASRILFDNYTLKGALAYAVVLLPVLPLFDLIRIYNKYIAEEQDEFKRHLFQQSTLVAFFGAIIVASAMG